MINTLISKKSGMLENISATYSAMWKCTLKICGLSPPYKI